MKNIETLTLPVREVNERIGVDMEPGFWAALVTLLAYPEVEYDPAADAIRFPSYVPFVQLATEFIEGIEQGIHDLRICERCAGYFDLNRTDGIFTDPVELEGFVCMTCAETMSAREYFESYLKLGRIR